MRLRKLPNNGFGFTADLAHFTGRTWLNVGSADKVTWYTRRRYSTGDTVRFHNLWEAAIPSKHDFLAKLPKADIEVETAQ